MLAGCNNPSVDQSNNQQDKTSFVNQNEPVENAFKNTFTLEEDNEDIIKFQDALD